MKTGRIRMTVSLLLVVGLAFGAASPLFLWLFPRSTDNINEAVEVFLNPEPSTKEFERIKELQERGNEPVRGVFFYQAYYEGDSEVQIYKMNLNGSNVARVTNNGAKYPRPSPNGILLAFTQPQLGNPEGNDLWIMPTDGSSDPIKIWNGPVDEYFSWSLDNKWIAFASLNSTRNISDPGERYSSAYDIYLINIETGELIKLIEEGRSPVWSLDGEKIYYVSSRNRSKSEEIKQDIFRINVDGSHETQILITAKADFSTPSPIHLSLSPDGKWIVFDAITLNDQIYKVTVNGDELTELAFESQYVRNKHPYWSDEGIVFTSARNDEPWTIYTMDRNGNNVKKVGDGIHYSTYPTCSPS